LRNDTSFDVEINDRFSLAETVKLAVCYAVAVCCADTNECELNRAICGIGRCINTVGNYTCVCPEGHMLTPDNNCMGSF